MSINSFSSIQSIVNKKKAAAQFTLVQSSNLKVWYKFNSNLTNSAPSFLGSNNGVLVSGSGATNTQVAISPTLSANSTVINMNTFNGGGTWTGNYTYINIGTISSLVLSQGFTICMFIYSTKTGGGDAYILSLNSTSANISNGDFNGGISISQASGGTYNTYVFNNYGATPAITISPNTWTHLAITLNSSNIYNVYINGSLTLSSQTNPYSYPTSTSFTPCSLGYYSPAYVHNSFQGNMADYRFYNTVLTGAEITSVYNGTG